MSTTAPAQVTASRTCSECGEATLVAHTADGQRRVELDATLTTRGLYWLDEHGRAHRRLLTELYAASRAGAELAGHDPHECPQPLAWWITR